ncbi:MAG TPA: DUF4846 domain-containing protein [Flavisolibacter sp.]|nr:DUF4846 domain-containing protein [Flavisolibacter sp.]
MRVLFYVLMGGCMQATDHASVTMTPLPTVTKDSLVSFNSNSWEYFLQHLPITEGVVVDYKGNPIANQDKQSGIIPYDVGSRDLQQCADALMRLRAEYLFGQERNSAIGFHFTDGQYYSFADYCNGKRPVAKGNTVQFIQSIPVPVSHNALRSYLDIVYTWAGTISLYHYLKPANDFGVGVIIITPGSPGHCCIIIDEKLSSKGERLFKLVEGYTPAQTMYVVSNPIHPSISPWYALRKGTITTASYQFENYALRRFD